MTKPVPQSATRPEPPRMDLYPPISEKESLIGFIRSISTETVSGIELKRGLATVERRSLTARRDRLMTWSTPTPSKGKIKALVANCFNALGGTSATEEEALATVELYITALEGKPQWAIERACMRFINGEVTGDEIGIRGKYDLRRPPTTAALRIITEKLVGPVAAELMLIRKVLAASPPKPQPTAEEKAKADAAITAWRAQQGIKAAAEANDTARAERRASTAKKVDDLHRERIRREYIAAGLEPPEPRADKLTPSLQLMLEMGWSIIDVPGGKRSLVAPEVQMTRREARYSEMGS